MKEFGKKTEKWAWIALISAIPIILFFLWEINGKIGLTEINITIIIFLAGIGLLYLAKWISKI